MSVEYLEDILRMSLLWYTIDAIDDIVVVVLKVFGAAQMLQVRRPEFSL